MKPQRLNWEHIVSKLKPAPEEACQPAPFGFATRVVAQWRTARRDESLRRWASWSFRTALASMAACAVLAFVQTLRDSSVVMPLPEPPSLTQLPPSP
jgi:hypothetical protein